MVEGSSADIQSNASAFFPQERDIGFLAYGYESSVQGFLNERVAIIASVPVRINQSVPGLRGGIGPCRLYQFYIKVGHIHIPLCQPMLVIVQDVQRLECFQCVLLLCFL